MRMRLPPAIALAAAIGLQATSAWTQGAPPLPDTQAAASAEASSPETPAFSLRTSIKSAALLFHAPDAPLLYPEQNGSESLSRVRFEPKVTLGRAAFEGAYEQRLVYTSGSAGFATLGVLPPGSAAPYRITQLDWSLSEASNGQWRHEIDRASARVDAGKIEFTIGRQAIGWGRGVAFGAVDLFSPFSPLEADREWRRGVDAARAEIKVGDKSSIEGVGAFGSSWDRSLVAGRVRGYRGRLDVEAMGGRRARDLFGGLTSSAAVGGAELHGELAAFHIPEPLPLDDRRTIWKAVAGGSYRLDIGKGVMMFAEYHYSGFGARQPEDIIRLLADPAYAERYLRGDTQILSRHATAILASYEESPTFSYSGQWVESLLDGSGVVAPALTVTLSDRLSLYYVLYLPYGSPPTGITLHSEYGVAPVSLFVQARMYF